MSDEEIPMTDAPSVEAIKERLKIEIPVEEEPVAGKGAEPDLSDELRKVGRQFAETLKAAWTSEERVKLEHEVREGVKSFADEVEKVIHEVRKSGAAQKMKEEAADIKTRAESGELAQKARVNFAQGLRWLSEELTKLANQFTPAEPAEKAPEVEEM
jgi:hypothetical protein